MGLTLALAGVVVVVVGACGGTAGRTGSTAGTSTTGATATALEAPVAHDARTTRPSTGPTERTRPTIPPAAAGGTTAPTGPTTPPGAYATVTRIVDGDTMEVDVGGRSETVRVIGIDTPETSSGTGVECFGLEATSRASALAEGRRVRLERDPSQGARDRYGRTLAHVVLDDGRIFAEVMLSEGAGREYTVARPYRHRPEFRAAEAEARSAGRGLWAGCRASTSSAPRATPPSTASTTPYRGGARPGPPASPSPTSVAPAPVPGGDKDCSDFATRAEAQGYFEARGGPRADPDRLDRDGDGQVCESLR